ncbi:MAG: hypothetical protein IJ943_02780 [Akkermansia sp.]|nr:hypothetical protein [Akkermansia sp.]
MDTLIKILKAGALLVVIIAAGVFTIVQMMGAGGSSQAGGDTPPAPPPPPIEEPKITEPVEIKPAEDPVQPDYMAVNRPAVLQNVRRQGKTYISSAAGNLNGQAVKKDWGFAATATFNYTWGMESTSYIEKNDGLTIVEVRSFDKVVENVAVSDVGVGMDIPDEVGTFLDVMVSLMNPSAAGWVSALNKRSVTVPDWALNLLRKVNCLPPNFDPQVLLGRMKMFTQEEGKYLLEGKKVRITFKDGQGIIRIEPIDGTALTPREMDVIKRSNFVMDHYLMPEREVAVGESWTVPGNVFGGMVDPRLSGKLTGEMKVSRKADFPMENGEIARRLGLEGGEVGFVSTVGNMSQTGRLHNISGSSLIPNSHNVVTEAEMTGYADYDEVSTDHLLFEARMTVMPKFRVRYTCEVKD